MARSKDMSKEYKLGWRYIVWVGGCDDYYKTHKDAKHAYDGWIAQGYKDVQIERIEKYELA